MQQEPGVLDADRQMAALQWGFRLFLGVELIPFIVLFTLRYELDGYYVAPTVNQWLGAIEGILMLISIWWLLGGLLAIRKNDLHTLQHRLKAAAGLGIVYMMLLIYEWSQRSVPVGTRYGETFYPTLGTSAFYTVCGLFALVAVAMRSGRVPFDSHNYWDAQAVTWYWVFQGLIAVSLYIYLYLI